ncbi:MAG TPA: helix-turn-helix domain-containing protein [Dehalococcoidia bacterium]|nr:helix-turn-helix domain-containing protein [Dehalococcoidia bacterium]
MTSEDRTAVERLRRAATTAGPIRVRCQILPLSDAGWSPPRIATHLAYHPHTVRAVLRRFQARGVAGLTPDAPGPPPDTTRRQQVTDALGRLLGQERTWTAAQLAAALGEQGIALSVRQTRRYLGRMGARWRRVQRTLAHKQDPARVAIATQTLDALKKGRPKTASRSSTSMSAASVPASP